MTPRIPSQHRAIKKSPLGPDACDQIDVAHNRINEVSGQKADDRNFRSANDMNSKALTKGDQRRILPHWTRRCNKYILKEFDLAPKYGVYCLPVNSDSGRAYYVRLNEEETTASPEDDSPSAVRVTRSSAKKMEEEEGVPFLSNHDIRSRSKSSKGSKREPPVIRWYRNKDGKIPDPNQKRKLPKSKERNGQKYEARLRHRINWFVPRFAHTRRVEIRKEHGVWVAVCECLNYIRNQKACRHVYAILRRYPKLTDATIRHWNIYHRDFLKDDEELTKKMKKIRDETVLSGVPVEIEDLVTEGKGRQDIEFYEEALGVPVLKGPSYWTEVKGYKAFPDMAPRVGGFGVSHETGLSERQEMLNQGPDSVDVDLDDSDPTDFFVAEDGEEEEETEEVSNEPVDRERVWNGCFTMFEGLCNDIRTKEQYDRLHRVLTEQRLQVAEENAPAESTHNPAGMATLPSVETNRTEKRKTKSGSPEAKGEKKRRR